MIRRATRDDREWILGISAEVYRELGDYRRIIGSWIDHAGVQAFVDEAEDGGERRGFTLIGFYTPEDAISDRPDEVSVADLLAIAVAPPHQGRGHGHALLRHAIDVARAASRERRVSEMRLTVAEDNERAWALFQRHGFAELDREYGTYDGGQRAIRMRLAL